MQKDTLQRNLAIWNSSLASRIEEVKIGRNRTIYFRYSAISQGPSETYYSGTRTMMVTPKRAFLMCFGPLWLLNHFYWKSISSDEA